MKRNLLLISVLLLISAGVYAEGGVTFSGDIETKWGVSCPWTNEDTAGRFTMGETSFKGKLDAYYENSSAYAEGTFSYDVNQGGNIAGGFNLALDELWADYSASFWGIRIGRQKIVWGKADGIDISNVVCPSDMSSLSAISNSLTKCAVDSIRLSLTGNLFTLDAYWIPFFMPAVLPMDENNNLRKYFVPSSVDFPVPSLGKTLSLPVTVNLFEKPELAVWNGEYGVKCSGYFSVCDVSLYAFYGWDDIPFMDYNLSYGEPADPSNPLTALPEELLIGGEYKRFSMIALDAAFPIGQTVLRTEGAFFPMRHFQKSSETILEENAEERQKALLDGTTAEPVETSLMRNQLSALAGIDWMPESWMITAQYYCDVLFGETEGLERKNNYEHGVTLSVSKTLAGETLKLSLAAVLGLNDFDSLFKPSVQYSISDQLNLSAGAFIFVPGKEEGTYGKYKDLSSFFIDAKFCF